jgi:hypothetical protein
VRYSLIEDIPAGRSQGKGTLTVRQRVVIRAY